MCPLYGKKFVNFRPILRLNCNLCQLFAAAYPISFKIHSKPKRLFSVLNHCNTNLVVTTTTTAAAAAAANATATVAAAANKTGELS
jgi:hypothetical protein